MVSNSESDPESVEQEYEESDQFMIAQDMRGSYFDRSIELENIIELPNESGSEFSNQDFEYDQNGFLKEHPEFQNSDSDEEGLA